MATRLELFKGIFRERILPHFPLAEERFKKHFRASCDLINLFRGKDGETPYLDMIGFVVLGLKPLAAGLEFDDI